MPSNTVISCKKLSLTLNNNTILENLSFSIDQGEIVTIIGLNGAGKSSLLKTIIGIYSPSSGTLSVNAQKIGYVPQKLQFDTSIPLTVEEFLQTYTNKSIDFMRNKLQEVNAFDILHKKLGQLSGGQLQKVLIANALLQEPDLLLLDEATAGIDMSGEQSFYELIEQIHREYKITIVMVSHDIHTVFAKSNRVLCLNKHLCCSGAPQDVSTHPEFTKLFGTHTAPYHHHHDHNHS